MKRVFTILCGFLLVCSLAGCDSAPKKNGPYVRFVLEVSQADMLRRLSDFSTDVHFNQAISQAQAAKDSGNKEEFIGLFDKAYNSVAPDGKLADIFGYVPRFQNKLTRGSTNAEIIAVLREFIKNGMDRVEHIIKQRLDVRPKDRTFITDIPIFRKMFAGSAEHTECAFITDVKAIPNSGCISVELGDINDLSRARHLLISGYSIEFWDTYENREIYPSMVIADKTLTNILATHRPADSTREGENLMEGKYTYLNELFKKLNPAADREGQLTPGPQVGYSYGKDTVLVNKYLAYDSVRANFPKDVKFMWSATPMNKEKDVYELCAIRTNAPSYCIAPVSGAMITDARAGYDASGKPDVTITMSNAGSQRWSDMTAAAAENSYGHRCVAITLDGQVYSAPRVQGRISGGNTEISGISTTDVAMDLARVLKDGGYPAKVSVISEKTETEK